MRTDRGEATAPRLEWSKLGLEWMGGARAGHARVVPSARIARCHHGGLRRFSRAQGAAGRACRVVEYALVGRGAEGVMPARRTRALAAPSAFPAGHPARAVADHGLHGP